MLPTGMFCLPAINGDKGRYVAAGSLGIDNDVEGRRMSTGSLNIGSDAEGRFGATGSLGVCNDNVVAGICDAAGKCEL
jgi:hypothetical protein